MTSRSVVVEITRLVDIREDERIEPVPLGDLHDVEAGDRAPYRSLARLSAAMSSMLSEAKSRSSGLISSSSASCSLACAPVPVSLPQRLRSITRV